MPEAAFVKNARAVRFCKEWKDCMPKDTCPADQVKAWPQLPLKAVTAFRDWVGLRYAAGTRLVRNGGDHIFAVHPDDDVAMCVFRHNRKFGE